MPRETFDTLAASPNTVKFHRNSAKSLATLASGTNADGTSYTLPVHEVGATATAVATGTADAQGVAATANMRLMGYCIRETAGSAAVATVALRNGVADTAALVAVEELAANGSVTRWFGPGGILCPLGVFVERVAGETELVLYTAVIS